MHPQFLYLLGARVSVLGWSWFGNPDPVPTECQTSKEECSLWKGRDAFRIVDVQGSLGDLNDAKAWSALEIVGKRLELRFLWY